MGMKREDGGCGDDVDGVGGGGGGGQLVIVSIMNRHALRRCHGDDDGDFAVDDGDDDNDVTNDLDDGVQDNTMRLVIYAILVIRSRSKSRKSRRGKGRQMTRRKKLWTRK